MTPEILLFLVAGLMGGTVNAAAGGAKLFVFPLLLASGLPPIQANATATLALWPAQLPAAWVYRKELLANTTGLLRQLVPALLGGFAGALTLIVSPKDRFVAAVPILLILAVGSILLGKRSAQLMQSVFSSGRLGPVISLLLFATGFYGGYFGAGLGFMLLAVLSVSAGIGLNQANAAKNLFAFLINSTAAVPLALSGLVDWSAALWVLLGGIAGGYLGARLTRRLPESWMRTGVAFLGLTLTVSFLCF